jgi:class 3 adenylate cyclase/tetratricopeptide (TPR) repeat protein
LQEKHDKEVANCRAAIAALEGQRGTLGDAVVELATAPLRARLANLQRPGGLQHRQVTVLFADVVGSTAMAQALDAEDTLALLNEAMRRMATLIEAHKGRVLRFTGDGIKAAFGMDAAREDDAERAVRAGLAMLAAGREQAQTAQRQYGVPDFALRVGVHTGDVALGAGVEADNTAMGATVNIAARMEQSAPPGTLRISHDTWALVRGLFAVEPQPPLLGKGVAAPMQTYLVSGALERSVASVERGLQGLATPMVGRDAELKRLLDAVAQSRQTRQLRALTLVGDAGLGKSRLLREWAAALARDPAGHGLLALRMQPDGLLRPWGLLRALLATKCGVADTDSAQVACDKVVAGLSPCFPDRGEQQAQLIGQLSGLDFSDRPHLRGLGPRALRDQAFAALRVWLQGLAARGEGWPVLVVEDLHWADDSSLDLLQHLQDHAAELPLALVMTCRPSLLERRPDGATPQARLHLHPLPAQAGDELARALLRRIDEVPERLLELIVARGEGNPYYMEELVRRLIDDGVIAVAEPHWTLRAQRLDTLRLPGTLVGLLQARLDALPVAERRAARQASIIGHVFWDDALQALDPAAPQALPQLERAGFVRGRDTSAVEGTPERHFDHHLLHEVTYDTLLKAERTLGHGAAARWLQARTQGRGAEFLAMTGEHAARADQTALAIDCFSEAGRQAGTRCATTAAASWLRRALDLLGDGDPMRRIDLLDQLDSVLDIMGDRAATDALHAEIAALLDKHPDDARQARLLFSQALLADRRGDAAASEPLARQTLELAERCAAAEWAAMALGQLAWLHFVRQDLAGARRHVEASLQWAARIDEEHRTLPTNQLLTLSAMILNAQGHLDEARGVLMTTLAGGEAAGSPRVQMGALDGLTGIAAALGRWDEAEAWTSRWLQLADSIGAKRDIAAAHMNAALAAKAQGDPARAIDLGERALAGARGNGDRRSESKVLQCLGESTRELGELADALEWYGQAQRLCETLDDAPGVCEARIGGALCHARLGQTEVALAIANTVMEQLGGNADATITLRAGCWQLLDALCDGRAAALLEPLFADVESRVEMLTRADDRDRLVQAIPEFRLVVDAYQRLRGAPTALD